MINNIDEVKEYDDLKHYNQTLSTIMNEDLDSTILNFKRKKRNKITKKTIKKIDSEKNNNIKHLLEACKCPLKFVNLFKGGLFSKIALSNNFVTVNDRNYESNNTLKK